MNQLAIVSVALALAGCSSTTAWTCGFSHRAEVLDAGGKCYDRDQETIEWLKREADEAREDRRRQSDELHLVVEEIKRLQEEERKRQAPK